MTARVLTAGIDVGSTYTKAVILDSFGRIVGRGLLKTGFKLPEAARRAYETALAAAGVGEQDLRYVVGTGYGRLHVTFADAHVTDLTAAARGACFLFPGTRTILDVGGQTMKATRVDEAVKVRSFRLNDKCAAGTGAFLEKTARYMGYSTDEIGPLAAMSRSPVSISGVCAVFAESEVINHLSLGASPSDIMQGAIHSLADRSIQLMRRVQLEPEYTLVGGILRFESMAAILREKLGAAVHTPAPEIVQMVGALGAAVLGQRRLVIDARPPAFDIAATLAATSENTRFGTAPDQERTWRRIASSPIDSRKWRGIMGAAVDPSIRTPEQLIDLARHGRLHKDDLAQLLASDQRQPFLDACAAIERTYTEACTAVGDPCLESGCALEGEICLQPIQRAEDDYQRACGEEWVRRFADPSHRIDPWRTA